MFGLDASQCLISKKEEYLTLEDYQGKVQRWCAGCGDNSVLTAVQKLCRDEQLPPELTAFVSGIGCASRLPHYMRTYGFHGLHGRALPTAQGVKIRRPDLNVFVNMGDGDCCSIGTAHWIHAIRMNFDMVAMMHDNNIYGLTKMQVSPTTPIGTKTNTTPRGSFLSPLNPLSATLGISNVSFVAQTVEWVPDLLYSVIKRAFEHKGFSFIRILQRCPHFMPTAFSNLLSDPDNLVLLKGKGSIPMSDDLSKVYRNSIDHDVSDLAAARAVADLENKVPVGVLYQNESVPRYNVLQKPMKAPTWEQRRDVLDDAFDRCGIAANN